MILSIPLPFYVCFSQASSPIKKQQQLNIYGWIYIRQQASGDTDVFSSQLVWPLTGEDTEGSYTLNLSFVLVLLCLPKVEFSHTCVPVWHFSTARRVTAILYFTLYVSFLLLCHCWLFIAILCVVPRCFAVILASVQAYLESAVTLCPFVVSVFLSSLCSCSSSFFVLAFHLCGHSAFL